MTPTVPAIVTPSPRRHDEVEMRANEPAVGVLQRMDGVGDRGAAPGQFAPDQRVNELRPARPRQIIRDLRHNMPRGDRSPIVRRERGGIRLLPDPVALGGPDRRASGQRHAGKMQFAPRVCELRRHGPEAIMRGGVAVNVRDVGDGGAIGRAAVGEPPGLADRPHGKVQSAIR